MPDYEIICWNENNFDITMNDYVKEAYENKKWAFVSDYARLYALYNEGGIYMDTDVEVIKPLNKFLKHKAFSGFENKKYIPNGIMGSEKNSEWIKKQLEYYDGKHFVKKDGTFDLTTNVITITNVTKKMIPELKLNNTFQDFDLVTFYTKDYFSPLNLDSFEKEFTNNTHTIHHFSGSWLPKYEKREIWLKRNNLLKIRELIIFPSIIVSYFRLGLNKLKVIKLSDKDLKENRDNIWSSRLFGKGGSDE